jgi:hypothetical protein
MPSNARGANRFSALTGASQSSLQKSKANSSTCTPATSSQSESGDTGITAGVPVPLIPLDNDMDTMSEVNQNHDIEMASPTRCTPAPAFPAATPMTLSAVGAASVPSSSSTPGSSTIAQSMATRLSNTPTSFTPPTAPSSYVGSTVSSIKPSSSVSVRAERDNKKRKTDDEDCSSMVSVASRSAVVSTISSGKRRRLPPVPTAIHEVGDQLGSLNETFRASVALMGTAISSRPAMMPASQSAAASMSQASTSNAVPTLPSRKDEATEKLVALEAGTLSPSQIVLIMDIFDKYPSQIDAYLVLTKDTPVYNAIRQEWLKKRIEEAEAQQSV